MDQYWKNFITPKSLEVEQETLTSTYGKFFCEPLERGYGITLGNALRRILLSSIRGSAIVAVRIEGVLHEFSTLTEVKEDVIEIILNLKEIQLKMDGNDIKTMRIKAQGEKEVKAGDIIRDASIKILNPEHHIATIGAGGKLDMELIVKNGVGYSPSEKNYSPDFPINTIAIDAVFSPIKKVNYKVTNARVGQITDYDKLTIEIWTNGSINPTDALSIAAKILKEQVQVFIGFEEKEELVKTFVQHPQEIKSEKAILYEKFSKPIEEIELSQRAQNCLLSAGIRYVGDIVKLTEKQLLETKNLGRKSLKEIKEVLSEMDLSLGMKIEDFYIEKK